MFSSEIQIFIKQLLLQNFYQNFNFVSGDVDLSRREKIFGGIIVIFVT